MQHTCSIIIPIFNEEENIAELERRLLILMKTLDMKTEIVLVDDGSRDRSFALMQDLCKRHSQFFYLQLSRNFGHQIAMTAGLDFCRGDCAVIMDADLQDPPEVVLQMIAEWRKGFDMVHGVRRSRAGETVFKKITAAVYYRLLKRLIKFDIPLDSGDFRLVDRKVIDGFREIREKNRYVRGLFAWSGFRQTIVHYDRAARFAGETKYPFRKMLKLALDGVIGFSNSPLRLALKIGLGMAIASLIGGFVALGLKVFGGYVVRGWTSMVLFMTFTSSIQLIVLGVMGEYIARINDEVKRRPLYFIREQNISGKSS